MDLITKMIMFIASKHAGQFDKAGLPYVLHPLAVMKFVLDSHGFSEDLALIALGHDLLEDTDTNRDELLNMGCSEHVVNCIEILTRKKNELYDEFIFRITKNRDATIVKIEDITHNMDISRMGYEDILEMSEVDFQRHCKYQRALYTLQNAERYRTIA